jgi:hypothetical protein
MAEYLERSGRAFWYFLVWEKGMERAISLF